MSDDIFHWRGLTFTMRENDPDYWESGRWAILRQRSSNSMRWLAMWRYNNDRWENSFDQERPWDRLASLEALLKALSKRMERYPPDKAQLYKRLSDLVTEERELLSDIEQRGELVSVVMKDISPIVHMVDYASQPDIQFRCDKAWDTPSWKQLGEKDPEKLNGVYKADGGRFYTFEESKITCPVCKKPNPEPPLAA